METTVIILVAAFVLTGIVPAVIKARRMQKGKGTAVTDRRDLL